MDATKPFTIAKPQVMVAFKAVRRCVSIVVLKVTKLVLGSFWQGSQSGSRGYLFTGSKAWSVRLLDGSGMNREVHVPFCERLGVRFPRPTHHEAFNTLKNQGYYLEHNYGHGQQHLATVFATLTMLAFLVDQVQEHSCRLFQAARARFHSRTSLWERMRAFFTDFRIPDWATLWRAIADKHVGPALIIDTS